MHYRISTVGWFYPLIVLLIFVLNAACVGKEHFSTVLLVEEDQGIHREREPVCGGIPLPQGAVMRAADLRVRTADGKLIPSQAHQLGLAWPDGSLRWALVQFQAAAPANAIARFTLETANTKGAPRPPARLQVEERTDGVMITTGPLRAYFDRRHCRLPNKVWINAKGVFTGKDLVLDEGAQFDLVADREAMTLDEFKHTGIDPNELSNFGLADAGKRVWNKLTRDIDYSQALTGAVQITVEESGPLRAVLRIEKAGEKREGEMGFVARVYAYAGHTALRVEMTLQSYEQFIPVSAKPYDMAICNGKHIRKFTYRLRPAFGQAQRVEVGGEQNTHTLSGAQDVVMRQLLPGNYALLTDEGTVVERGEHAPGWMTAQGQAHDITLASKWFWQIAPKRMTYAPANGEIALELWPSSAKGTGYPLMAGRERTYEFVLGFDMPGAQASAMARAELRPIAEPEYLTATGATHRFVPLQDERFSIYRTYVENTLRRMYAQRLYGDIDFGDQGGWLGLESRWNDYHGVSHEWMMFYLASAKPEHFRLAEAAVWHSLDVDTQHWGYNPGCREAEYARPQDHICASPIQGGIKMWIFGEIDYYLLTGKRRVWESLKNSQDFLMHCGGSTPETFTNERATALPFTYLCYLYEVMGTEAAIAKQYPTAFPKKTYLARSDTLDDAAATAWVERLQAMAHHLANCYRAGNYPHCSFMAAYPAEGLYRFWELTGDTQAKQGVCDVATTVYTRLTLPTGIPLYAGTPPWESHSAWQPHVDEVEFPAARAYMVSGDKKYLEYGKAPVDWRMNYYQVPWAFCGNNSTTPLYLWALRDAGMTQNDLSRLRPDIDYEAALATTKERAMANFNLPPSGEQRAYCLLAMEVGRVLINQGKYDEALAWLRQWQTRSESYGIDRFILRATMLQGAAKTP